MHRHPIAGWLKSGYSRPATGVSAQKLFFPADQVFDTLEEAEEYAFTLAKEP
jgi:hypothetical protein